MTAEENARLDQFAAGGDAESDSDTGSGGEDGGGTTDGEDGGGTTDGEDGDAPPAADRPREDADGESLRSDRDSDAGDPDDSAAHPEADPDVADAAAEAVAPAVPTYRWAPTERECAACGDAATALWTDGDGALVCPACKAWSR